MKKVKKQVWKRVGAVMAAGVLVLGTASTVGCSSKAGDQVVIYSNADDEAVVAMKAALDANGYEGEYIFQTFGTSELGGKLLAEGKNLEADLVTMSTFYLESAQEEQNMFTDLTFEPDTLEEYPSYCTPITAQEGTLIVNTEEMEAENLEAAKSIRIWQNQNIRLYRSEQILRPLPQHGF